MNTNCGSLLLIRDRLPHSTSRGYPDTILLNSSNIFDKNVKKLLVKNRVEPSKKSKVEKECTVEIIEPDIVEVSGPTSSHPVKVIIKLASRDLIVNLS